MEQRSNFKIQYSGSADGKFYYWVTLSESREISMLTKQHQVATILEVHVTEIANQSIEQLKKYES